MKNVICFIIVSLATLILFGCGNQASSTIEETTENVVETPAETTVEPTTETPTEPQTTEPPQLSDDCDKILASGTNESGDIYELVGYEEENYEGLSIKFGIIKNNQWVVKPTNDIVFEKGSAKSIDNLHMYYIGNGCFLQKISKVTSAGVAYFRYIAYNADIDKSYSTGDFSTFSIPIPDDVENNGNKIIISWIRYQGVSNFTILNTNDMTTYDFSVDGYVKNYSHISEDLFAVSIGDSNYPECSFYTTDGKKDTNISSYKMDSTANRDSSGHLNIAFHDGECTFDIINENRTPYTITIDRSGKVLNSQKTY